MKPAKHKKSKANPESFDGELDDGRPVRIEALGELTSSEVIEEVKAGMSRIMSDDDLIDQGNDEFQEDAA